MTACIEKINSPEVIAPGGSLASALTAFEYGADAVYVGLTSFSARVNAQNLTQEELSKLKKKASELGKKVYVAMNTVIKNDELDAAISILSYLSLIDIDGIVVQDIGLLDILLRYFPELPVHASTQMAVHNADGIRYLKNRGAKRVILPRELSFSEIAELRESEPGIELEVFVHGALCYSFSGLCLASGIMFGRSGNRGDCAQVCRSWFEQGKERGYFFSSNDLALRESVIRLGEIGIAGLKIEGRMKPPEYAGLASAYYRAILDGEDPSDAQRLFDDIKTVFMRKPTTGFFSTTKGKDIVSPDYPGHRGIRIGVVSGKKPGSFSIRLELPVSLHDGLLFFSKGKLPEPHKFGLQRMRKDNKNIFRAEIGDTVEIEAGELPEIGAEVYKISSVELKEKEKNPARMQTYKRSVDIAVTLTAGRIEIESGERRFPHRCLADVHAHVQSAEGNVEESASRSDFTVILASLFAESGNSLFAAARIELKNASGCADDAVFIRPSVLKRIKNEFYRAMDDSFVKASKSYSLAIRASIDASLRARNKAGEQGISGSRGPVIARERLSPRGDSELPWIDDLGRIELDLLSTQGELVFLPLAPLSFDSPHDLLTLRDFIEAHPDVDFAIGLSNIAHLEWVTTLTQFPRVGFFIDFFLYCANTASFGYFLSAVPRLIFQYYWIEGKADDYESLKHAIPGHGKTLVTVGREFNPPLLLSRACFLYHGSNGSCTDGCEKYKKIMLTQNKRKFRVIVQDCTTFLFKDRDSSGG